MCYKKAALYISKVRKWVSRVNGNPHERGETGLYDGTCMAGQLLLLQIGIKPNRLILPLQLIE